MPVIPLRGIGARGIAPDKPPYAIEPVSAWVAHNMRQVQGEIATAPGYNRQVIEDTGSGAIDGTDLIPKSIGGWQTGNLQYWVYCCTTAGGEHRLYTYDGTDLRDVSPGGAPVASDDWEFIQMGPRLIAHSPTEIPLYLNSGTGQFQPLTGWDTRPGGDGWRCGVLKPFGSFLIAAPILDGGEDRYASVAWSHEMPPDIDNGEVNWDYSDPTKLAGENVLDPEAGRILWMEPLGQQMMIYCEYSVWAMSFVGGGLVFNFRQVFSDDGILNKHSVAEIDDNRHAVIGRHNLYIHDGNSKAFPADGRTRYFFYSQLQEQTVCRVHTQLLRDDIMFIYAADPDTVDPNDPHYDRALIYNWRFDCWSTQDLPDLIDMAEMPLPAGATTWANIAGTWDDQDRPWGLSLAIGTLLPIWISARNKLTYVDLFGNTFDGTPIEWRLRFELQDFDTLMGQMGGAPTINRWKYIRAMWPQVSGNGDMTIGAKGFQTYPTRMPYEVTPADLPILATYSIGDQHKASFEVSGRYVSIEFKPTADAEASRDARFVGFDTDLVPQTMRN